jgi:hypothetical protein
MRLDVEALQVLFSTIRQFGRFLVSVSIYGDSIEKLEG